VVNATAETIGAQIKAVRRTLAQSEDTVQQYRDQKRIVNIKQETDTDLHKIAELKIQRANLQMSLAAANNLYAYMTDGKRSALDMAPNFEAFNDMLSTDIVKKVKDLQAERHDLLLRFTPEDDKVKTVDMKLADLNGYLLESVRNTRNALTIKYRGIDQTIRQAEGTFIGLPTREKNLAGLQRDFELNEKLYTFLREKETEAAIAKATPTSYHRIIAGGEVPTEPTSPHRAFVLVISGFLGMLLGVLLVAYVVYLQSSVLLETRRHNREMQTQRDLADKAEASRFTELRNFLEAQATARSAQDGERHAAMLARAQQTENSLAAHIGQLEDRLERRPMTSHTEVVPTGAPSRF